eukprot:TRINITY_DN5228_c0_g1_i5.p1 TRINITY_DN5228_c0_g1~~TRINITY_DN5228_c0_g1_i5.p1  ORF type:complete len:161 (+),score=18.57 TRINITY_DN5228_c0_g1_i5:240-722(+)
MSSSGINAEYGSTQISPMDDPVITTEDWTLWTKICGSFIALCGLGLLVLGQLKMGSYIIACGTLFLLVGLFGVFVAFKKRPEFARLYYRALVVTAVTTAFLFIEDIGSISDWVNDYCNDNDLDDDLCTTERTRKWIFSVVGFIVSIMGCCLEYCSRENLV